MILEFILIVLKEIGDIAHVNSLFSKARTLVDAIINEFGIYSYRVKDRKYHSVDLEEESYHVFFPYLVKTRTHALLRALLLDTRLQKNTLILEPDSQARIQRGSSCSYNTLKECKVMTCMSL